MELGESEEACARRELLEETGLSITLRRVVGTSYPTFVGELAGEPDVVLSDEHDALDWVDAEELVRRCRPDPVSSGLADALARLGHRVPT
jgi:8-oxo-dGTP pyrophosphatase MutT (NUDIX family)